MAGGAALERASAKLERGVSDAYHDCGAGSTQQCTSPAAGGALALASLVSYRPLARLSFTREVVVQDSSPYRSNTGSRGGLREWDRVAPQALPKLKRLCAKHQAPPKRRNRERARGQHLLRPSRARRRRELCRREPPPAKGCPAATKDAPHGPLRDRRLRRHGDRGDGPEAEPAQS